MEKSVFLSIFISSLLFLCTAYFAITPYYAQYGLPIVALAFVLLLAGIFRFLGRDSATAFVLVSILWLLLFNVGHIATIYLQFCLLSLAAYNIWERRAALIAGCGSPKKRVALGVLIFFIMLGASFLANVLLYFAGLSDNGKVVGIVSGLPLYLIIATFTLGPLSEELFFRAWLVPVIGVPLSSLLFMVVHVAYGSISEFAGAFALGFVLANAYYFTKDPLPCMIAHALFNLLAIVAVFWVLT